MAPESDYKRPCLSGAMHGNGDCAVCEGAPADGEPPRPCVAGCGGYAHRECLSAGPGSLRRGLCKSCAEERRE